VNCDLNDLPDNIAQAFQVLDVDRGIDADPAIEQLFDILPAFGMARAGNIGVGQFINQNQVGMARQCCINIKFLLRGAPVFHLPPGQDFQPGQQGFGLDAPVRLHDAHNHVNPFVAAQTGSIQHAVGFAYPGCCPKEDFQFAPFRLPVLCLNTGQQHIGIGSLVIGHGVRSSRARFSFKTFTRGSPKMPNCRSSM